jgi:hypothetical protein
MVFKKDVEEVVVYFDLLLKEHRSRGSSVSIVSGYGLEDRTIEVRSPAEIRVFFL